MFNLYDSLEYGVCITTSDYRVRFANPFFLSLLGYRLEELQGRRFEDLTNDEAHSHKELYEAFESGKIDSYHIEQKYIGKSGEPIWIRLKVSRLSKIVRGAKGIFAEAMETTPLKVAEETGNALLKSYKDLFDASNDLAFILSRTGEIIDLNRSALKYFDRNPSEIISTSIIDHVSKQKSNLDLVTECFEKAWNGNSQRFEWWASVNGADIPQEVVLSKAEYLGEAVLIASVRDISERIVSERKLMEQEALLRLVTENSTDAVCLFDADQTLLYISPVIEKLIGYSPEELVEIGFHELIHPEDKNHVAHQIESSIAKQHSQSRYKYRQQRKDGSFFWLEVNAWRRYDREGNIVQTIANLRDVDDQVTAETKIKASERFLAETQRLAGLGSWEYDLAHGKFKFSHEYSNLFQIPESESSSLDTLLRHVVKEDRAMVEQKIQALLEKGSGFNLDFSIELPTGGIRSFNGIGYAERDANGRIARVRGAVIDITRRKNNETVLRNLKERAEHAAEVKQQFLSNMSHELRTPLNAVLGMTDLLKAEDPRPDQLEKIKLLQYSAENLLHIINEILDFSALEEKQLKLHPEEFELDELMNSVIHLFTERAREDGIRLKLDLQDIPKLIRADKYRLNQVLFNLIDNAIKFTDKGEVCVSVKTLEQGPDHVRLAFHVIDTGVGIPEEEYGHIFKRFHQTKLGQSFKYAGTGLGLSITRGLLQLMGTEIHLTSKVGKGTTFSFELEVETPLTGAVKDTSGSYGNEHSDLSHLRVLVAEDNTINQFVVKKILARWRIDPVMVENGLAVLELIMDQNKEFDVLLLDLQMPELGGIETTRKLRQHGIKTPIIAITAAVLPDQRSHVIECGMDAFIGKPFNPNELHQVLIKYGKNLVL